LDDLLCKLEEELMAKGGRWIADFNESERDYRLEDVTFDVCIRGDTRIRESGFFSRAMDAFLLPRYLVVCYVLVIESATTNFLRKCLRLIENKSHTDQVTWSWLILISQRDPLRDVIEFTVGLKDQKVGLLLYDPNSGSLVTSGNQLGARMKSCVRLWSKGSRR
jgi:hypothetical protein